MQSNEDHWPWRSTLILLWCTEKTTQAVLRNGRIDRPPYNDDASSRGRLTARHPGRPPLAGSFLRRPIRWACDRGESLLPVAVMALATLALPFVESASIEARISGGQRRTGLSRSIGPFILECIRRSGASNTWWRRGANFNQWSSLNIKWTAMLCMCWRSRRKRVPFLVQMYCLFATQQEIHIVIVLADVSTAAHTISVDCQGITIVMARSPDWLQCTILLLFKATLHHVCRCGMSSNVDVDV